MKRFLPSLSRCWQTTLIQHHCGAGDPRSVLLSGCRPRMMAIDLRIMRAFTAMVGLPRLDVAIWKLWLVGWVEKRPVSSTLLSSLLVGHTSRTTSGDTTSLSLSILIYLFCRSKGTCRRKGTGKRKANREEKLSILAYRAKTTPHKGFIPSLVQVSCLGPGCRLPLGPTQRSRCQRTLRLGL